MKEHRATSGPRDRQHVIWLVLTLLGVAGLCLLALAPTQPTEAKIRDLRPAPARPNACQDLIQNGSFESGDFSNWTTAGSPAVVTTSAYSGTYSVLLGGSNNDDDTFYQEVTLPVTVTSADLTFWRHITSTEFGTPWDFMYVEARDTGGALLETLLTLNSSYASAGWEQSAVDLTAFPSLLGQTFRLTFHGTTDSMNPTSFYVDLIKMDVCAGASCTPDFYEPNNSQAGAALVSLPLLTDTLRICPWDEDWFRFDMQAGYRLTVDLAFQHAVGDLDLHLYDLAGTLLDWSTGTSDYEQIVYDVTVAGPYFVRVFPFSPSDDQVVPYSLSIQELALITPTPTQPTPTPTPTSTPTPSPTPSEPPLPQVDLDVPYIELTQSIQSLANDIPIIAGKKAYVRIYVQTDGAVVKDVQGHLEGERDGVPLSPAQVPCVNTISADHSTSLETRRGSLNHSLYCLVPQDWLNTTGTLDITGRVHSASIHDPDPSNNWSHVIKNVEASPPLHIQVVQVRDGWPWDAKGPSPSDYYKMHLVTERMYPVSKVTMHPAKNWVWWSGDELTIVWIAGVDLLDRDPGPNTVHVGVVRNNNLTKWGGMGSPFGHTWVVVRPDYWDGFGNTTAHEIGHGFGMFHVKNCNAGWPWEAYPYPVMWLSAGDPDDHYGIDTGYSPPDLYPPRLSRDLMGYCHPRWASPYTYKKLRTTLRAGAGLPLQQSELLSLGPQPRQFKPDQDTEYLLMVGQLYTETGAITLTPMMRLMGADLDPEAELNPAGPYTVQLLDAGDNLLGQEFFGPLTGNHQEEGALLKLLVPYVTGTARIAILDPSETEIFSCPVSANPPQVALDPVTGPVTEAFTAAWTASDPDGDPISATLLFSADGGGTWDPVVWGTSGSQAELDPSLWPGTGQGMLRVLVTDGVNTGEDVVGPFEVAAKAPLVFVGAPDDGAVLPPAVPVFFTAVGYDAEDGPLGDEAYTWTSNRDGNLGTGEEILVESLSPGWHEIIVTATDSDINSTSDSIQVYVGYRIYLPLVVR